MLPTVIDPKTKMQQLPQKVSGRPSSIQPFPPKITPYSWTETKTDRDKEEEQARAFALDDLPGSRHCLVPQKSPEKNPKPSSSKRTTDEIRIQETTQSKPKRIESREV
jgi:hypothetical protein